MWLQQIFANIQTLLFRQDMPTATTEHTKASTESYRETRQIRQIQDRLAELDIRLSHLQNR